MHVRLLGKRMGSCQYAALEHVALHCLSRWRWISRRIPVNIANTNLKNALVLLAVLLSSRTILAEQPAANEKLARQLQDLNTNVILRGTVRRNVLAPMISRHAAAGLRTVNRQDKAAWEKIRTLADWKTYRQEKVDRLGRSLGQYPAPPSDLKIRRTGTVRGDGFEVDKLVYESREGVQVTANLYRPAKPKKSMPGILISHSHHSPKDIKSRPPMGMTWARAGCVVLVPDHLGHGERRQHPFGTSYTPAYRPKTEQDYYFRYDLGMQLHLIGDSLMGWYVWDMRRGLDVLLSQAGVDSNRILIISEPSGAGDIAGVTAALDERVTGAMVQNFGGYEPENDYPLPADTEYSFPYATGGSWESTRALTRSAGDGFLPWTIVAAIAPRRLIYYIELDWDEHHDPVWKRLQKVFSLYEAREHVTAISGWGFVVGSTPENTHWLPVNRELLYPTLEKWFAIPNQKKEYHQPIPRNRLLAWPGSKDESTATPSVLPVIERVGQLRSNSAREMLAKLSRTERREQLREKWLKLLGKASPAAVRINSHEHQQLGALRVERIDLATEPGIVVPVLLLSQGKQTKPRPVVVAFCQEGKARLVKERSGDVAQLLAAGNAVCLLDVRGTGETDPGGERGRYALTTRISSTELMLGRTLLGGRLHDVRQVLGYLRSREDLNGQDISVWGDSFARQNAKDSTVAVMHRAEKRPSISEPLGGLLALLTALVEPDVRAVYARGGLTGLEQTLASPFCYFPHDIVVPGALTAGDLCDLAAVLAPRPVHLEGLVDGTNRPVDAEQLATIYAAAWKAYQRADAANRFHVSSEQAATSPAQWILETRK